MSSTLVDTLKGIWEYLPARYRTRLYAWLSKPQYPMGLQIEQTHRCNLKCVMCVHGFGDPQAEKWSDLSLEKFKELIDQFRGENAKEGFGRLAAIELQGIGEPLLHKDTISMVEYARSKNIDVFFISNMTVLTENLAKALVASPPIFITASVDSIDADVFQDIRRGVHFSVLDKVLKNIALIQRVKEEAGSILPEIHVNSVLMKRTLPRVPELVKTLSALGVSKIYLLDLIALGLPSDIQFNDGTYVKDQTLRNLPQEEQTQIANDLRKLGNNKCEVIVSGLGSDEQTFRSDALLTCDDLWEKPYITSEGVVKPCCYLPDRDTLPMGNINENTFDKIWFGQAYQDLRWRHISGNLPWHCANCPALKRTVVRRSPINKFPMLPENLPRTPVFQGKKRFSLKGDN